MCNKILFFACKLPDVICLCVNIVYFCSVKRAIIEPRILQNIYFVQDNSQVAECKYINF